MFFDLIKRNAKKSRKENSIYFTSLVVTIVCFYALLALPRQDIMVFLATIESDSVSSIVNFLLPVLMVFVSIILSFMIFFAIKYQLDRRKHEFGVYLVLGMKKTKLFFMLFFEDILNSFFAILIGLPVSFFICELVSFITARLVGIGTEGHTYSFSPKAVLILSLAFIIIKMLCFLILSIRIFSLDLKSLLENSKDLKPYKFIGGKNKIALILGSILLAIAYFLIVSETVWYEPLVFVTSLSLGLVGTLLFFYGFRILIDFVAKKSSLGLGKYTYRQIEDGVSKKTWSMAINGIILLLAISFLAFGASINANHKYQDPRSFDYTFMPYTEKGDQEPIIRENGIDKDFEEFFSLKIKNARIDLEGVEKTIKIFNDKDPRKRRLLDAYKDTPKEDGTMGFRDNAYLINLSGYNKILQLAGKEKLDLKENEIAFYVDQQFLTRNLDKALEKLLENEPKIKVEGKEFKLAKKFESQKLITDRSLNLLLGLVVSDEDYEKLNEAYEEKYMNAVFSEEKIKEKGLVKTYIEENKKLDDLGFAYESYFQGIGRNLFYTATASYLGVYLATVLFVIVNTVLSVQFLIGQGEKSRSYKSLIKLGASYKDLKKTSRKEIVWHFLLPLAFALFSAGFGTTSLVKSTLRINSEAAFKEEILIGLTIVAFVCVVEYIYMRAVFLTSDKYVMGLFKGDREE